LLSKGNNCEKGVIIRREFWSINDFILQNWGACVDTVFGHVAGRIMKLGSADGKVMTGQQGSCRWPMIPMMKQHEGGIVKSRNNG